jgi:hypothetical protein
MQQLFTDFKKAHDIFRRDDLCNILTEVGIPLKLVRLKKVGLNETNSGARLGKHLSDMFPFKNG